MKNIFDILLNEYLLDSSKEINVDASYYKSFIKDAPEVLYSLFPKNEYKIKASIGNGNKSFIPWVCVYDKRITNTASKGFYIAILFKKDMSGFYLTLMQGYTAYKKYGKDKLDFALRVSEYLQTLIECHDFSLDKITLGKGGHLALGYEACTIISRYYGKNNYQEERLIKDILLMKEIYKQLADNFAGVEYEELIESIINNFDTYIIDEVERKEIEQQLLDLNDEKEAVVRTLERVEFPTSKRNKKEATKVVEKTVKKIDHIKKLRKNIDTGIMGEMLVLDYEKDRLKQLGHDDLAEKVRWIANIDDSKGYDIESYAIDKDGKVKKIYIEVKTTDGNANSPFFISRNEKNQIEVYKEKYYIYRVYNINTDKPSLFVINYKDFKNKIKIDAELFKAKINY